MSQIRLTESIPKRELLESGHLACPGCGAALAMRFALKALGERTIVTLPACCWSIIAGPWPQSSLKVPLYHTAFETGASVASGIKAALLARGDTETTVIAWAGDGGTFDIGLQALSGAAERNEDILYFCYDNEAYMNTGIQRSSATPYGAWTTTTPGEHGKARPKKDILAILAAHRIPYAASASIGYPDDLIAKVVKARSVHGTRFVHILAPCPPGWKSSDDETIELARMAVRARVFPLVEVEDGERWRITLDPPREPVRRYVERQGRFRHLTAEEIDSIQSQVDARWASLELRVNGASRPTPSPGPQENPAGFSCPEMTESPDNRSGIRSRSTGSAQCDPARRPAMFCRAHEVASAHDVRREPRHDRCETQTGSASGARARDGKAGTASRSGR